MRATCLITQFINTHTHIIHTPQADMPPRSGIQYCKLHPTAGLIADDKGGFWICQQPNCARVVGPVIHEGEEYRRFGASDKSKNDGDPSRVVGPDDEFVGSSLPILSHKPGTVLSKEREHAERLITSMTASDQKHYRVVFQRLEEFAGRLHLKGHVTGQAKVMYRELREKKICQSRKRVDVLAICLYIVLARNGMARTFQEMAALSKRPVKTLQHVYKDIAHAQDYSDVPVQDPTTMMRFVDYVGYPKEWKPHIKYMLRAEKLVMHKRATTYVAAAIYMVALAAGKPESDISRIGGATGCSDSTIRQTYAEFYQVRNYLFQKSFPYLEGVAILPAPRKSHVRTLDSPEAIAAAVKLLESNGFSDVMAPASLPVAAAKPLSYSASAASTAINTPATMQPASALSYS
eukprot:m.62676 g.62676  ORF g.62676 m.62676 type:complete len:405 (-) comp11920_c1_seq3:430-1644(-)